MQNGELLSFLLSGTGGAAGRAEEFAVRPRFGNAGREWWREAERMKGREGGNTASACRAERCLMRGRTRL
jgi:hypothetical protein